MKKEIVIFGAGNIGRSFLAPVFCEGGWQAVFADVDSMILEALSQRDSYELIEVSAKGEQRHSVGPVFGVDSRDEKLVSQHLLRADMCATCVGAKALPIVLRSIAKALNTRTRPLDIILAENLKGAAELAKKILQEWGPRDVLDRVGIVETSIGKMVPIMDPQEHEKDPLLCRAEPFHTLIVDKMGFQGSIPTLPNLKAVHPIAPWVARKLYIHNFGHAAAAYLGFASAPEATYIWQVLEIPRVAKQVRRAMLTSGEALQKEYPGVFRSQDITAHVDDLLERFANQSLGDTVYRVGRDLARKLHYRDRVVGAIALMRKHKLDAQDAIEVFQAALQFCPRSPDGSPDALDSTVIQGTKDAKAFLNSIVGLDEVREPDLHKVLLSVLPSSSQDIPFLG